MTDTIVAALIAGGVTLAVSFINNAFQKKKQDQEQDKRIDALKHEYEKQMIQMQAMFERNIADLSATFQQSIAVLDCKFDEITRKVEKHNSIVERTYNLESRCDLIDEKQKVANHRIDDIEKKVQ